MEAIIIILLVLILLRVSYSTCVTNIPMNTQSDNGLISARFTPAPIQNTAAGTNTYNDTIQSMALESDVYSSHHQFLDSLNLTWTPLNASEKSDRVDINGRVGLMPVDYRNKINADQHISIPEDSVAIPDLNTKNRWGGYGYDKKCGPPC